MSYAPYPAYKDTRGVWLDKIPSHWDARPLKYDIGLQNGAAFKPTEWSQTGTPIIRIENLNGGGEFNCFEGEIHPRYVIQKGDVLFGWSGNRGTSFGPFRWEKEGRYYLNQHIFKIEHQNLDQGWLYWALRAVTSHIESEAHGIIGMVHITKQKLGNIFLPVVPIEEQTAIAEFLDKKTAEIDDLIAKKEELLRLLAEQRTALITHAVTKGLNPNAPMKPSGIDWLGNVPEGWEVKPIKHLLLPKKGAIKTGPFGSQLTSSDMFSGEIKVYNQRTVLDNDFDAGLNYISLEKFNDLQAFEVFPGDVLVTTRGTIGRTALAPQGIERGILHPCLMRPRIPQVTR